MLLTSTVPVPVGVKLILLLPAAAVITRLPETPLIAEIDGAVRVLLVRVCVPVNVATVESMPIVRVVVVLTLAMLVVIPEVLVKVRLSVPRATEAEVEPPAFNDNVVLIAAVPAAVKRPFASTVNVGIAVEEPYEPGVTAVFARVAIPVTLPVPSNEPDV